MQPSAPREGNSDFEALAAQYARVRSLALAIARNANLADDLAQDAWVALLRRRPDSSGSLSGWLAKAMRNLLRQGARDDAQRRDREEAAVEALDAVGADLALERFEMHRAILDAVNELKEPYRTTVLLRWFEELEPSAIAERTGVPVRTVHTRVTRALAMLRRKLGPKWGSSGPLSAFVAWLSGMQSPAWKGTLAMQTKTKVALAATVLGCAAVVIPVMFLRQSSDAHEESGASAPLMAALPQREVSDLPAGFDRVEVPRSGRNHEALVASVLLCAADLENHPTSALLSDLRALGPAAAEALVDRLIQSSSDERAKGRLLILLRDLGSVGAQIEDDLLAWSCRPENADDAQLIVETLLAQESSAGREAATSVATSQAERAQEHADIEAGLRLEGIVDRLEESRTTESLTLLEGVADEIEMVEDSLTESKRHLRAGEDRARVTLTMRWNEVCSRALLAIARMDTPDSISALERRITDPTNATQRRLALETLATTMNERPESGLGPRFTGWAQSILAALTPESDPWEVSAALAVVAACGQEDLQAIVAMRDLLPEDQNRLARTAWFRAVNVAARRAPDSGGVLAVGDMLRAGWWPDHESDPSGDLRAGLVAVLSRSTDSREIEAIDEMVRKGDCSEVYSVLKGAPPEYWRERQDDLGAVVERFKGIPGLERGLVGRAVEILTRTASDPIAVLSRLEAGQDTNLARLIENTRRETELAGVAGLPLGTAVEAIALMFSRVNAWEREKLIKAAMEHGRDEAAAPQDVAAWIDTRTLPVLVRSALLRGLLCRGLPTPPQSLAESIRWLVLDAEKPEECRDTFRLIVVVAQRYPDECPELVRAIEPWLAHGKPATCDCLASCVTGVEQLIGTTATAVVPTSANK
jgi:RNA polymerase sigma factor (sigma-70 family)